MRRLSIKDIARMAHVSHSTVSRALRRSSLVNAETAERIRCIAQESGYRASAAARSLVTNRSRTIGVVVTTIVDPFAAEVLRGIDDAAKDHDYSVLLANSDADPKREIEVVRSFEERRVDGIIVTSSRVGAVYAAMLSEMQIPIVLLNNQHPSEFVFSVTIANTEASYAATRHLIELGHRAIAYIGDRFGHQSDTDRFAGYRSALDEADIAFQPEYVVHGDGKAEGGALAMARLLTLPQPPTAVFCYNDVTALGALSLIRAEGFTVPGDISVVGFDDLFFARYIDPPLTTVRQPMIGMGRKATETLLTLIGGSSTGRRIAVPGELIVRHSTAPPRRPALSL